MGYKSVFRWLFVFSVVTSMLLLAPPLHMIQVYDRVLSSGSLATLFYISLIAVAALALFGVAEAVRLKLAQRMSAKFAMEVADDLFAGLAYQPGSSEKSAGLLRDFDTVKRFLASKAMISLFDLPFAPMFLAMLFFVHTQLGILTFIGIFALVSIALLNKKMTAKNVENSARTSGAAMGFAHAVFARKDDVRAMGLLPAISNRWGLQMADALSAADVAAFESANFFGLSRFIRQSIQIITMGWGANLVLQGDMSGGVIFAASMISGRALQPIEQIIGSWDMIAQARTAHSNITGFIADNLDQSKHIRLPEVKGLLDVSHLTYVPDGAGPDDALVNDVSLTVQPGEIVALVGPTGAGKSTLARLIVGALSATSGKVMVDGHERDNWLADQWGTTVGYVAQEISLFPGTVAENIARMSLDPDEAAVTQAAKLAGVHELIGQLPSGYASEIGPGKVRLSGGQNQRIAFARALYSQPKVLILDEPNANLDQQGEQYLMRALVHLKQQGVAVLVVAQRQAIVAVADRIVTMTRGKITNIATRSQDATNPEPATAQQMPPGRVRGPQMQAPNMQAPNVRGSS